MKKLLIGVLVLLLIVAAGFGYVLFNANSLIARYTPEFERIASETLKTSVKFGSVTTSVFPAVRLNVNNVALGGDKGLSLNDLSIHLRLLPLLSKKLVISKISLDRPEINMTKDAQGIKIAGLPSSPNTPAEKAPTNNSPAPNPASSEPAGASPLEISLESIVISNGKFVFNDTTTKQNHTLTDFDLNATIALAGTTTQIPNLAISAKCFGDTPLKLTVSKLAFDSAAQRVGIPEIQVGLADIMMNISAEMSLKDGVGSAKVTSSGIPLATVARIGAKVNPTAAQFGLGGDVVPDFDIALNGADVAVNGALGLRNISAATGSTTISELNGQIKINREAGADIIRSSDLSFRGNALPFSTQLEVVRKGNDITVNKLDVGAFGGSIVVTAALNSVTQNFKATTNISELNLGEAVKFASPAAGGLVTGQLKVAVLNSAGQLGATLMPSLRGEGTLALQDITITGFNLAGEVLGAVKGLPFMSGSLGEILQGGQVDISGNKTALSSVRSNFLIADNTLNLSNLEAVSPLFTLQSSGPVEFSGRLNLKSEIAFAKQVTTALSARVKELGALSDQDGRLIIPLMIVGQPGAIKVLPNIQRLVELGAKNAIKQKAGDFLGQVLGGKKKQAGGLGGLGSALGF